MLKIDKVQLEILINGDPARLQLNQLSKEAANLKKEYAKAKTELEKKVALDKLREVESQMEAIRNQIGLAGMSMKELGQRSKQLRAILNQLKPNTAEFAAYRRELDEVNARQRELRGNVAETGGVFSSIGAKIAIATAAVAGIVSAFGGLISKTIETYGEFEKYKAVLTNAYGSSEIAAEKMTMLQDVAAALPVSLREVTEGFIKLKNSGMEPTKDLLITLSDLAASQGKSLDQYIEALKDAKTYQYERLREFGITAATVGDKVNFTFKNQITTVEKNGQSIEKYLVSLGKLPGIAGSSTAVMETLQGKMSNLGDSVDRFFVALGEGKLGGAIKSIVGWMSSMIDKARDFISSPLSEKLETIKTILIAVTAGIIGYVTAIKLATFWQDLQNKESAINIALTKAKLIADNAAKGVVLLFAAAKALLTGNINRAAAAMRLFNATTKMNPIMLLIGVIIAAGTALMLYSRNLNAAEKAQKTLSDINNIARKNIVEDKLRMEELLKVAQNEKKTKEERLHAIEELNKISPKYLGNLTLENINTTAAKDATDEYIKSLERKARVIAAQEKLVELEKNLIDLESKVGETNNWQKVGNAILSVGNGAAMAVLNAKSAIKNYGAAMDEIIAKRKVLTGIIVSANEAETKNKEVIPNKGVDLTDAKKKKALEAGLKALVVTYNKEKLIAADRFASGKISIIEYNDFIKALEEQNNRNRLALMKVYGQDISAEEAKQVEERIKQAEESGNDWNKVYEDLVKVRIQLEKDSEDDLLKVIDETNKEQQKKYKEYEDQQTSDLNKAGTIVNELRNGNKNEELKRLEEQSEALRIARDNDLITETEYQNVLSANRIEAEAEKISVIASYAIQGAQMVQQIYDTNLKVVQTKYDKEQKALDDKHTLGLISDTEYNKKKKQLEEQSEKEQKAIKKRQANVEFIIQMASIIASTAQAVAKSVAASPLTLGLPWSAINAGIGIAQLGIATYQKAKVSQAAKGRYNVIGADDGRAYNNVPYTGDAKTGFYNSPTLVAERGREIVIDNPTVKRLMANEPYIIDRILANRVPQQATGNYPVQGSGQSSGGNDQLIQYMAASMTMMAEIKAQFAQGIEAKMSHERFDIDREKWDKQKQDVTRT